MQDAHEHTCAGTADESQQDTLLLIPQGSVALATIKGSTENNGLTEVTLLGAEGFSSTTCKASALQHFSQQHVGKTVACVQPLGASNPMIMGLVFNASASENSLLDDLLENNAEAAEPPPEVKQQKLADTVEIDLSEIAAAELHAHDTGLIDQEDNESDPERLILRAQQSVVIKCGESSISLEADGRIRLNGRNIFSRASHLQRIAGGAIKLN